MTDIPSMEAVNLALNYINLACNAGDTSQEDAQRALFQFRAWLFSGCASNYAASEIFRIASMAGYPDSMIPGG